MNYQDFSDIYSQSYEFNHLELDSLLNPRPTLPQFLAQSGSEHEPQIHHNQQEIAAFPQNTPNVGISTEGAEDREMRATNTVFKTGLGEFRKILLEIVKAKNGRLRDYSDFIIEKIDSFYKHKNQSTFLKLLVIVRQLKISQKIQEKWLARSRLVLKKKRHLHERNKYALKRLEELQKSLKVMTLALKQKDIHISSEIYWGKHKQAEKYENCKKEVIEFKQSFGIALSQKEKEVQEKNRALENKKQRKQLFRRGLRRLKVIQLINNREDKQKIEEIASDNIS